MRRCATILAAALALAPFAGAESKSAIPWQPPSDSAWQSAAASARPVLIDLWSAENHLSMKMEREVWSDPRVVELAGRFVCLTMRVVGDGRTANLTLYTRNRLPIDRYPCIIVFDPWEDLLFLEQGYRSISQLVELLSAVPADFTALRPWHEALVRDRNHGAALVHFGAFYQDSRSFGLANHYLRQALNTRAGKADATLREDALFRIGTNEVRRNDWPAARKALEQFRAECPESPRLDQVLLGLVLADAKQGRPRDAERHFAELSAAFPNARATDVARGIVARLK